jgi:hypothetical protein
MQNNINAPITVNADGFDLEAGVIKRKLRITGGDVEIVGSGVEAYTFPVASCTLFGTNDMLDEDNMASNLATKFPSQQSTKAYIDAKMVNYDGGSATTVYGAVAGSPVDGGDATP